MVCSGIRRVLNDAETQHNVVLARPERKLKDVALDDAVTIRLRAVHLVRLDGGAQIRRGQRRSRKLHDHFAEAAGTAARFEDLHADYPAVRAAATGLRRGNGACRSFDSVVLVYESSWVMR